MSFFRDVVGDRVGLTMVLLSSLLFLYRCDAMAQPANMPPGGDALSLPPSEWARLAAENEIKIIRYHSPYLRYRVHLVDTKGDQTRDVIESTEGAIARLIGRSGKPLTRQQDNAERSRLQAMLDAPQTFSKHIRDEQTGKQIAVDILAMLPQAMTYSYAPGQPQRAEAAAGHVGGQEVVLDFKPNPQWKAPNLKAEALTGLDGRLWIDPETQVVTGLDGRIFQAINFGWGMVAHIYPGGTLKVEQVALPGHRFFASHFVEDVTVRAMLVKMLKVHEESTSSDFSPIRELSYRQAIQTLLDTPLITAD
jgi:hypothetical protein